MYVKIPIQINFSTSTIGQSNLDCSYVRSPKVGKAHGDYLKYLTRFAFASGIAEIICVAFACAYLHNKTIDLHNLNQGYVAVTMGFRRFTFKEFKKATDNFSNEIGRGGSGVVNKGVLEDMKVVTEEARGSESWIRSTILE
uniref:Uncharacterized protein n=1 Tax=Nymphaea colorata TaxID=210225 RepID=A0A5K0YVE8_9MAGN|nr:unnamed protein product [Nymphaea colorata]